MPGSLRREIGQLLIGSLPGQTITPEMKSLAREFELGGVILFGRNIEAPEQVAELAYDTQQLVPSVPLWVSVDQEGGRVARLKAPFTEWPPMAVLGRRGDEGLARRFAAALAAELRAVGITLDYAPVLDIHTNPKNPVIGDRALAEQARTVADLGAAIVRVLQEHGVAACGKHFPGHGDTSTDSHHELPLIEHPPEVLREREFLPFRAAIGAGVATIMTAHVFIPALDDQRPATLSKRIVTGLLREELGFEGVIISDDLEMKALAGDRAVSDSAIEAIEAGCDAVLICSGDTNAQAAAVEALVREVEKDRAFEKRVGDALLRNQRAKERFLTTRVGAAPLNTAALRRVLGQDAHQRTADDMARFA